MSAMSSDKLALCRKFRKRPDSSSTVPSLQTKLRDFSIGICRLDLLARVSRLNELFNNFDNSESAENGIVALIDGRIRPAIVVHKVYVAMISIGSLIT